LLREADIQKRPIQYERTARPEVSDIYAPMYRNYEICINYLETIPKDLSFNVNMPMPWEIPWVVLAGTGS